MMMMMMMMMMLMMMMIMVMMTFFFTRDTPRGESCARCAAISRKASGTRCAASRRSLAQLIPSHYATIAKRREGDSASVVGLLGLGHGIKPTQGQGCRLGDGNIAGATAIAGSSSEEYALSFGLHHSVTGLWRRTPETGRLRSTAEVEKLAFSPTSS